MSAPAAKMSVLVGEKFACVKISGRANFTSSIDFKTLLDELRQKGCDYFVLDVGECMLMDSTFLGVLAGFGLKMNQVAPAESLPRGIELLNPRPRIVELLESLGVLHLFRLTEGQLPTNCAETAAPAQSSPSRTEITSACLEAHQTLMSLNAANAARFKDVAAYLTEDLKKLRGER